MVRHPLVRTLWRDGPARGGRAGLKMRTLVLKMIIVRSEGLTWASHPGYSTTTPFGE